MKLELGLKRLDLILSYYRQMNDLFSPTFSCGGKSELKLRKSSFIKMQEFAALEPFLLCRSCQHVGESQPTHHLFPACITNIASALPSSRRTLTY